VHAFIAAEGQQLNERFLYDERCRRPVTSGYCPIRSQRHRSAALNFLTMAGTCAEEHQSPRSAPPLNRLQSGRPAAASPTSLRIFNRLYDLYPGQRATVGDARCHTNILDNNSTSLNLAARPRSGRVFQKRRRFR